MSVRRLNLRFNLDREEERRAWEYLQGVTRSKNSVIIQAVNAYEDALTQREREDAFLERLARTVRAELKGVQIMVAQPSPQTASVPVGETAEQAESADTLLEFLDSF